jgi:hypothetical protein
MRQGTYLNVILTVNALLLSALVWTQLADRPMLAEPVQAQQPRDAPLNAGAQRHRMIELLNEVKRESERTRKVIESGDVRVKVTNLNEITIESGTTRE